MSQKIILSTTEIDSILEYINKTNFKGDLFWVTQLISTVACLSTSPLLMSLEIISTSLAGLVV